MKEKKKLIAFRYCQESDSWEYITVPDDIATKAVAARWAKTALEPGTYIIGRTVLKTSIAEATVVERKITFE